MAQSINYGMMMSDLTHPAVRHFSATAETVEEYPGASFYHTGVDTADVPKVTSPPALDSHWVLSACAINLEGEVCSAAAPSLLAHIGRPGWCCGFCLLGTSWRFVLTSKELYLTEACLETHAIS